MRFEKITLDFGQFLELKGLNLNMLFRVRNIWIGASGYQHRRKWLFYVFFLLQTYFNIDILTLVRNLVTGSVDPDLDIILSQGRQPDGTPETPEIKLARNRCRVEQLSLNDDSFKGLGVSTSADDLLMMSSKPNIPVGTRH